MAGLKPDAVADKWGFQHSIGHELLEGVHNGVEHPFSYVVFPNIH